MGPPDATIEPHVGIGPLRFGMSPGEVEAIVGPPVEMKPWEGRYQGGLEIQFAEGVDAMTVSWSDHDDTMKLTIDGLVIFDEPAHAVVESLSGRSKARYYEARTSCVFHELDLVLWRPVPPGSPFEEYRQGLYWQTLTLARAGYADEYARNLYCDGEDDGR